MLTAGSMAFARQPGKQPKNNQSENPDFKFTVVKELGNTSIKNQGSSGTCWSYSGNSFLESEMIRMGKPAVDLAEIFTARNAYHDKAKQYVLFGGAISWGDGGELHDVINMYKSMVQCLRRFIQDFRQDRPKITLVKCRVLSSLCLMLM